SSLKHTSAPVTLGSVIFFSFKQKTAYDIISTRSKVFQKLDVNIDSLPLRDLFELIQKNPGLLRRPIILDEKRLQVGYNEDEIRRFLPRTVRTFQLREAQRMVN